MELAPLEFTEWFNKLLKDNTLGVREAARRIKISHPLVSDLQNGARATEGTCVKIAIAFDYPADVVLSLAGYRPQKSNKSHIEERINFRVSTLPEEDQKDVEAYIELRHRIVNERGKYEPTEKKTRS